MTNAPKTSNLPSHILEAPEEVLSTMNKDGSRKWMYPKKSPGQWYNRRRIVGIVLIILFFAMPMIHINGEPAMLLDFVHRRFSLFGMVFYATDTMLLMLTGLTLVMSVVWFTALFGRVWCGWGCPQTVYMEFIFRPIERFFEGKENARRKRDKGPWNGDKIRRKVGKFATYTVIAALMAHTFVAYFVGWKQLLEWMTGPPLEHSGFFLMMALTTGLIVFDFGYFREQMCTLACPYARLQSVLMDRDSLIVSYDERRGENRGRRNKKQRQQEKEGIQLELGDCVDCGACVRTCPTGIDIRNGLQLECIGCTQCVDACDPIMIGLGKQPGLIRYTSENTLEGKPSKILRPRLLIYTTILTLLIGALAMGVSTTGGIDINVIRAPGAPFMVLPDGNVTNRLKIRAQNRTGATREVSVKITEPEGATVRGQGGAKISLEPGKLKRLEVFVVIPPEAFKDGQTTAKITIGDGTEQDETIEFLMLGPVSAK